MLIAPQESLVGENCANPGMKTLNENLVPSGVSHMWSAPQNPQRFRVFPNSPPHFPLCITESP